MEFKWRHSGLFTSSSCCVETSKNNRNKKRFAVGVYLVGFTGELAATELALDFALGAVVLQVVGQVAARQLDGAAVGAGDHIEGAGGEVSLRGTKTNTQVRKYTNQSVR